jgi:hypothetical protein
MKSTIDMAKEAGLLTWLKPPEDVIERFKAFEALVRADERERAMRENAYVQAEREACAKVCDDIDAEYEGEDVLATWCSRAIRNRGNT